jgi:hypothetical protein
MFSSRTSWDRTANRLSSLAEAARRDGTLRFDLTETNPTRVGIPYPKAAILRAVSALGSLVYEPDPAGLRAARETVAGLYAGKGFRVDPEDVFLAASTSEAYAWLFKLLVDPGGEVLVPRPSYPLFEYLAGLESARPTFYRLHYDGAWTVDLGSVREATPRARAIVVVNPNNPTGNFLKRGELRKISTCCRERGLALIGDEVFGEYPAGPDPDRVESVLEAREVLAFSLGGLSKLAGLPQMKLAWIVVGGPDRARREARERLEVIADTYLSVNAPVQNGLPGLLEAGAEIRVRIRGRVAANRRILEDAFRGDGPCELLASEGGWSAILRLPEVRTEEEWCTTLLAEDGVLVHPGYFFDIDSGAHVVASLLPPEEGFRTATHRIRSRVDRLAGTRPVPGGGW